jgi:hypothetical protein
MDQSRYEYVLLQFQNYFIVNSCLHELLRIVLDIAINQSMYLM